MRKRDSLCKLCLLLWAIVIFGACSQAVKIGDVQASDVAPDFSMESAEGETHTLSALRGEVVLLSFLNTQAEAVADNPDMSRSQVVFLRSMAKQYGGKGVRVLIVDAAELVTGTSSVPDALINYGYDWHLEGIPVLVDPKQATARAYGVTQTPTTFLIDTEGSVQQRWDGFVSAQELAFALQELVGDPVYRDREQ